MRAFLVKNGMRAKRDGYAYAVQIFTLLDGRHEHTYYVKNNTIGFIKENRLYVIPFSEAIEKELKDDGYTYTPMYVPFADENDVPTERYGEFKFIFGR